MGNTEEDEEEEELARMVNDYIESADHSSPSSLQLSSSPQSAAPLCQRLQEAIGKVTDEEVEIQERVSKYVNEDHQNGKNQKEIVVKNLRNNGYEASLCKTTWNSTFRCSKGNYEYIEVIVKKGVDDDEVKRVIVDMDFRSQFEVARPTKSYRKLIENLPLIFVGTEEKLNQIICLLCPACKESLKKKGLHIPPWRKTSYMKSKWLSKNCKRVSVSSSDADLGMDENEAAEEEGENTTSTCCAFKF